MKATSERYRSLALSWLLVVGLATGVTVLWVEAGGASTPARAQPQSNGMAIDADPSTAAVDAGAARPLDVEFDVGVSITRADTPYNGYDLVVQFDSSKLAWVSVPPVGFVYVNSEIHGMTIQANALLTGDMASGGAARQGDAISFTGLVALARFKCVAPGAAWLHLVSTADPSATATSTLAAGGVEIDTALTDAQITCGEGSGPVPTIPPGASPTPAPPGPTPTLVGPRPTPTPLPPGLEAVPLGAGCNPVTSTYPDDTAIRSIADAVGPAGNLISLWKFDAGTWRAFSPQYPQASDLTDANLLDVVFACVGEPGDFVRPIV
jgi:hypothetical protein